MSKRILCFLLVFAAVAYPLGFLLLALRNENPWLPLAYAAAWGITCGGWLHKFCREEWLELSMSVYCGVTACVTVLSAFWTLFTFFAGDAADGLCALGASVGLCLPYFVLYGLGKWQDGRGKFPTGQAPAVLSVILYGFVIGLPFLRAGVRLLSERLYEGHPHIVMEYYRNTPREVYQTEITVFTVLFFLAPVLCMTAGWLKTQKT